MYQKQYLNTLNNKYEFPWIVDHFGLLFSRKTYDDAVMQEMSNYASELREKYNIKFILK